MRSHTLLGGGDPQEGDNWKPRLSWILLHQPLDFNVHPFAVMKGTMSVTALLGSVGPSGELLNLRVVSGTPDIMVFLACSFDASVHCKRPVLC